MENSEKMNLAIDVAKAITNTTSTRFFDDVAKQWADEGKFWLSAFFRDDDGALIVEFRSPQDEKFWALFEGSDEMWVTLLEEVSTVTGSLSRRVD